MKTHQISLLSDRTQILDTGRSRRLVQVRFTAPCASSQRMPIHLGVALDRSRSMSGKKLALAKLAIRHMLSRLTPSDYFSIIAYDSWTQVVASSTRATPDAITETIGRVAALMPGDATDVYSGWMMTCAHVAARLSARSVGRVIVISDGRANWGDHRWSGMAASVEEQRKKRIVTSTIGLGTEFDERLLSEMAVVGGGHYYFVDEAAQLPVALNAEVEETLAVASRQAELFVRAPSGAQVEVVNGYPCTAVAGVERGESGFRISLGDLVSGQMVSLLLMVTLPPGRLGSQCSLSVAASDADGALSGPAAVVQWLRVDSATNNSQCREPEVTRRAAVLFAAQSIQHALDRNRKGEFRAAHEILTHTADQNRRVAGQDDFQLAIVEELSRYAEKFAEPLSGLESKTLYSHAYGALAGRLAVA